METNDPYLTDGGITVFGNNFIWISYGGLREFYCINADAAGGFVLTKSSVGNLFTTSHVNMHY